MKEAMEKILSQYGQNAVVECWETGERSPVRAFIQPILRPQEDLPLTATPLGAVSRQRWLYIGSGDVPLSPGDYVTAGDLAMTVQEARPLFCGDCLLYRWALLRRKKEAAV